jgi:hypothetical protein
MVFQFQERLCQPPAIEAKVVAILRVTRVGLRYDLDVGNGVLKELAGGVSVLASQPEPREVEHRTCHSILVIRDFRGFGGKLLVDGQRLAVQLLRLRSPLIILE